MSVSSTGWSQWTENNEFTPIASNASTLSGNNGISIASSNIPELAGPLRVANVEIEYKYDTFPRTVVFDSFGFTQAPAKWHDIMGFAPGLMEATKIVERVIKGMAQSENAASKLVLVLVFSEVYSKNHPQFWKQVRHVATEELFNFIGAADKYYCFFKNIKSCGHTQLREQRISGADSIYTVSKGGEVVCLTSNRDNHLYSDDEVHLGTLPRLFISVL